MLTTTNPTMSSREIAELTGKQHHHVKRDIANMMMELELDVSKFGCTYLDGQNRKQTEYNLDRELTDCLLTGYSARARMAVIKRWHELENQTQAPKIPQTLSEALQLAADQARQLEEQAPKVKVYEALADRKGDVSTTVLAKQLGMTAIKLNRFLREQGIKMQRLDAPKAGYGDWFNVVSDIKNGHEYTQCLITPEGQVGIADLIANKNIK